MRFLVASLRHELLPLAHRLRREGHEVEVLVWRSRFEAAWSGSLPKIARHSDHTVMAETLRPQIEAASKGELAVITDVRRIATMFQGAKVLCGPGPQQDQPEKDPLWFGGWFDGEAVQAPHLLVCDWGLWTGGGGPSMLGGLTLVRVAGFPEPVQHGLRAACERMKSESFHGLFGFDVQEELASGLLQLHNLQCGWPWLMTQVFLAELQNLGQTVDGNRPQLVRKFVSVLPVSLPPWPSEESRHKEEAQAVQGLTIQQQGACFWFDIRVEEQPVRQLVNAGLDGLLCVATGHADSTPALARARALELAQKIAIPQKQFRHDMGALVDRVLSTLEDRYGYVV